MENQEKQIVRASWVSIAGNALLSVLKIFIGLISGSMAVLADGIDSAGDIIASAITLVTARVISRPPNLKYVYGYERADTIASKVLSFIIFFAGAQLAITTINHLIEGEKSVMPSMLAVYVTVFSIMGKVMLAWYQYTIGKKTGSLMLQANGKNMMGDVVISLAVLIGLVFTFVMKMPVFDKITALIVSGWIIYLAFRIFRESSLQLMDGVDDESVYDRVFKAISKVEGASNPHRTRIRKIGHQYMVAVDIEVDGDMPLKMAHQLAHQVEKQIKLELTDVYDVMVHTEPVGDDPAEEKFGISEDNFQKLKKTRRSKSKNT